jgi:2-polyprenyl-3-methyl-5-hydroxy-6-metoxy-1,4-benzoquinol methylase
MKTPINSQSDLIHGRGSSFCRGCSEEELFTAIDLGNLPIANELQLTPDANIEKFPLHLKICKACGLGQVADVTTPERIFKDYRYLSSMSTTFVEHASRYAERTIQEGIITNQGWVLEIASNDGYLLKNYKEKGIKCLGIEPAENVAEYTAKLGIETISDFFSKNLASEILTKYGYPSLIVANNVLAHVPDLSDFVAGLSTLCGPNTIISVENPSLLNILVGMQFDTIYHEHYSYLTATAVSKIAEIHQLVLYDVEELTIHGGSNRYWIRTKIADSSISDSVARVMKKELDYAAFKPITWINYSEKVAKILGDFVLWITQKTTETRIIFGYGAAAKASTILNSTNLKAGTLSGIADLSLEKQKRYMPPSGIPIISPLELQNSGVTDIVIFPWNIEAELAGYLRNQLGVDARLWCLIPELREIKS